MRNRSGKQTLRNRLGLSTDISNHHSQDELSIHNIISTITLCRIKFREMQNVTKIQKEYAKWTIQKQFSYWTIVAKILVLTFTITCFKFSCKWQNGNICPWLIYDQLPPPPTHTHLMALCLGLPGWASTRKVKPICILLKQQTVSGSGISWAVFQSAYRSRQITMPAHHNSVFLQSGCSSCRPTNSVKAPINNTDIKHKTKKWYAHGVPPFILNVTASHIILLITIEFIFLSTTEHWSDVNL